VETLADIDTPLAHVLTGARQRTWDRARGKGYYEHAPPLTNPSKRLWSVDHLLALRWWDSLARARTPLPLAGQMSAALLQALLAYPEAEVLYLFTWEAAGGLRGHMSIGPTPPSDAPTARPIADLPVKRWKQELRAAIAKHHQRKAASHVRPR
jgi:hypothetical protein